MVTASTAQLCHFRFTAIDDALRGVEVYNTQYPAAPLDVKLRVFAGPNSPDWVKHLSGEPVTVVHRPQEVSGGIHEAVGYFWSAEYGKAWRALQTALAAKYDNDQLISTVAASSCSSITDESLLLPGDAESRTNLLAAGFTNQQFQECVLSAIDDYASWKHSFLEFTFNPFRRIEGKQIQVDNEIAFQLMAQCRKQLGTCCILSTHFLGGDNNGDIFARIQQFGAPIAFQTVAPSKLSADTKATDHLIDQAVNYGASSVEIWPQKDSFSSIPRENLQAWATKLQSIPPIPSSATPAATP